MQSIISLNWLFLRESAFGVHFPTQNKIKNKKNQQQHLTSSSIVQSFKAISIFQNFQSRTMNYGQHETGRNENANLNGYGGDYQKSSNQFTEENSYSTHRYDSKIPLKLVMDPRGVVQDVHTQGITYDHSSGMLSPDKCAELVSALHTDAPKGKGCTVKFIFFFYCLARCDVLILDFFFVKKNDI